MLLTAEIQGLPELAAKLDIMQQKIAGPIVRRALHEGGEILRQAAERNIHRITGALQLALMVKVAVFAQNLESFALIGAGMDPANFRRVAMNRRAGNREAQPQIDQTTNPGIYGLFVEVGHRAPGEGLAHNAEYRKTAANLRRRGKLLNTFTKPSSREYGHLNTPPHPWLGPAADEYGDTAVQVVGESIKTDLDAMGDNT